MALRRPCNGLVHFSTLHAVFGCYAYAGWQFMSKGRRHRSSRDNIIVRILMGILQVFSWMWHDIKPSRSGGRHRHRRSFWRRVWDGISQPFRWMINDLKRDPDSLSVGEWVKEVGLGTVASIRHDIRFRLNRETMAQALYLALVVLIAIRIMAVWKTIEYSGADPFYTLRHIVFTIVWSMLLYFFYNLFLLKKSITPLIRNLKEMERASLMAFIACVVKFVTSASYIVTQRLATLAINWATAYYIGELLIWGLLAVFLFFFWRNRRNIRIASQDRNHRFEA